MFVWVAMHTLAGAVISDGAVLRSKLPFLLLLLLCLLLLLHLQCMVLQVNNASATANYDDATSIDTVPGLLLLLLLLLPTTILVDVAVAAGVVARIVDGKLHAAALIFVVGVGFT